MKLFVRFVLGLGLGSVAICHSLALDTHDLQKDRTSTLNGPQGYVRGYVAAVVEERAMSKSPTSSGSLSLHIHLSAPRKPCRVPRRSV